MPFLQRSLKGVQKLDALSLRGCWCCKAWRRTWSLRGGSNHGDQAKRSLRLLAAASCRLVLSCSSCVVALPRRFFVEVFERG